MAAESWATSAGTRKSMLANKRRDTAPEIAIRRLLHARGLRYRVDFAPVPGVRRRADIVFTRVRVVVFIDGCFWHGCPVHATHPKQNAEYWGPKLAKNMERDRDTDRRLEAAGWRVFRYWEHETPEAVAERVSAVVEAARTDG
ncbi:very short patch repair endonuclease [Humibacter antri]